MHPWKALRTGLTIGMLVGAALTLVYMFTSGETSEATLYLAAFVGWPLSFPLFAAYDTVGMPHPSYVFIAPTINGLLLGGAWAGWCAYRLSRRNPRRDAA